MVVRGIVLLVAGALAGDDRDRWWHHVLDLISGSAGGRHPGATGKCGKHRRGRGVLAGLSGGHPGRSWQDELRGCGAGRSSPPRVAASGLACCSRRRIRRSTRSCPSWWLPGRWLSSPYAHSRPSSGASRRECSFSAARRFRLSRQPRLRFSHSRPPPQCRLRRRCASIDPPAARRDPAATRRTGRPARQ